MPSKSSEQAKAAAIENVSRLILIGGTLYGAWWLGSKMYDTMADFFDDPDKIDTGQIPEKDIDPKRRNAVWLRDYSHTDSGGKLYGKIYYIPDWSPAKIAGALFSAMNGLQNGDIGQTKRSNVWAWLVMQNSDVLKVIHNYWLKSVHKESLYDWIDWEAGVVPNSVEEHRRSGALRKLSSAGLR